jgi:vitamin B12 transporter
MQRVVIWVSLCLAVMAGAQPTWAVDDETPVVQTDDVVTSATKTPVPVSHVTSAVEVITAEEMKRQNYKTVVEALRMAQGITVLQSGGPGTEATVLIRGGSESQTMVLIDGAIVNSATNGYFNFANLTTDNIERIEILRGAQSMLWGSDAIGGVINITTKKGAGPTKGGMFAEYGSFNSIREGGAVSGKKGVFDYSLSMSRWDFAGLSAADYRLGATERDAYRNWTASSQLGVDLPKEGRLEFAFRWINSSINLDNISPPPTDVFASKSKAQQFIFSGNYQQKITNWWDQKLTLARSQEQSLFLPGSLQRSLVTGTASQPVGSIQQVNVLSNRMEWQHNFQVAEPLLVTAGYQFREQQGVNTTGLSERVIASHAGFAQAQLNLWDRVFGTAGIRQDSYNVFGEATTYRVTGGYLHKETDTKIRTSYSTGFRAPTINDLFYPNYGNPQTKAEKSQSFDLGVDQWLFKKKLQLSGGYFWNRYRDLITVTYDPVVCAPFSTFSYCPINVGSASTKGYEASFTYTEVLNLPMLKAFDVHGQYTNTMSRDLITGARLPRVPVDQWSMTFGYKPVEPVRLALTGRMMGSRFNTTSDQQNTPGFVVWNLAGTYDVTDRIQGYVRAENLFNQHYQEILNAGMPVRSIYFGVRLNHDLFS